MSVGLRALTMTADFLGSNPISALCDPGEILCPQFLRSLKNNCSNLTHSHLERVKNTLIPTPVSGVLDLGRGQEIHNVQQTSQLVQVPFYGSS